MTDVANYNFHKASVGSNTEGLRVKAVRRDEPLKLFLLLLLFVIAAKPLKLSKK